MQDPDGWTGVSQATLASGTGHPASSPFFPRGLIAPTGPAGGAQDRVLQHLRPICQQVGLPASFILELAASLGTGAPGEQPMVLRPGCHLPSFSLISP